MKLSRFFGATTRDVMRQVREALGPDALIVSNRSIDGGIEVVAAQEHLHDDASPQAEAPAPQLPVRAAEAAPRPSESPMAPTLVVPAAAMPRASTKVSPPPAGRPMAPPPASALQADLAAALSASSVPTARPAVRLPDAPPNAPYAGLYRMPGGTPAFVAPPSTAVPVQLPALTGGMPGIAARMRVAPAQPSAAPVQESPAQLPQPQLQPRSQPQPRFQPPQAQPLASADVPPPRTAEPVPAPRVLEPLLPLRVDEPVPPLRAAEAVQSRAPAPEVRPSMARLPDAPMPRVVPALRAETGDPMQAALDALRGSLESRMDGLLWGGPQGPGAEPVKAALLRSLLECGFSMPLVRSLLERLPADMDRHAALAWSRNELVASLPVLRDEDELLADGGVFALVGPTGVGKTTTLAKLAARCVDREGRDQVAMLTTDMFRIGALEQLQIYGRLMGIPAHSVRDADELKQALAHLGSRRIILIDTTGISQRDRKVAAQAALLHAAGRPVRRLLVLNAASQGDTLDEVAHAYRNGAGEDVVGCIVTKLDEATRIGPALDTAIRHRLPIHYVSVGQQVPADMAVAEAQPLIDRALEAAMGQASALYAPSEADLAALWRAAGQVSGEDVSRRRQLLATAILRHQASGIDVLDQATAWLDGDAASGLARDNWRAQAAGAPNAALESMCQAGLDVARREFSRGSDRYLLAMHGKSGIKAGQGTPAATLMASLLMTDRGAALSAPVPQLMLPHGILACYAQGALVQGNVADALGLRIQALLAGLRELPQVHLFEMGAAALGQGLALPGVAWVARAPAGLRVIQEDTPTTLGAVSRDLGYLPAGQAPLRGHDEVESPLDLWASGTEVRLPMRGEALALRMVCARLTDPVTGKTVDQLYGLTNLKSAQADAASVARWLLLHEQAKVAFRYMGHAWAALPAAASVQGMPHQAAQAAQLGAACWQLVHAPAASEAMDLVQAFAAPGRKLPAVALPAALLRTFAMLEITS